MPKTQSDPDGRADSVLGHVVPRRRFTAWAVYYLLLYFGLPVLALGLVVSLLLYAVFDGFL